MKDWRDAEHKVSYYFDTENGRIVGQVFNLAHTNIWGAKVYDPNNGHNEKTLGQYITFEFSKKAVEHFWLMQERTLSYEAT
jgi:hypothetical protein